MLNLQPSPIGFDPMATPLQTAIRTRPMAHPDRHHMARSNWTPATGDCLIPDREGPRGPGNWITGTRAVLADFHRACQD